MFFSGVSMCFFVILLKLREVHTFSGGPSSPFVISTVAGLTAVPFLDAGASFDARGASATAVPKPIRATKQRQFVVPIRLQVQNGSPSASHLDSIFLFFLLSLVLRLFLASKKALVGTLGKVELTLRHGSSLQPRLLADPPA